MNNWNYVKLASAFMVLGLPAGQKGEGRTKFALPYCIATGLALGSLASRAVPSNRHLKNIPHSRLCKGIFNIIIGSD